MPVTDSAVDSDGDIDGTLFLHAIKIFSRTLKADRPAALRLKWQNIELQKSTSTLFINSPPYSHSIDWSMGGGGGSPTAYVIRGREVWGVTGAGESRRCCLRIGHRAPGGTRVGRTRGGWYTGRVVRRTGGTRAGWYAGGEKKDLRMQ